MRVLSLTWEHPPAIVGGLGRHVDRLSRALADRGVCVDVVTRGADGVGTGAEAASTGVRVHRVGWSESGRVPGDLDAFLDWVATMNAALHDAGFALARSGGIDLVHSHDWLVADAARRVAVAARVPWVVTVHATEHGRHAGRVARHPQSAIHAAERAMVADADRIITCSRFMREHVASVFGRPSETIAVIPNGIDARDLRPVASDLPGLRARLAAPGQRLVLLAGRLVYEKGFAVALRALAPLVAAGDVRFAVAGSGPAEPELRREARGLGIARGGTFLGWVGDDVVHGLYRVADVCLVPSLYEPAGLVALEAMASSCPCVLADTGGLRELAAGSPPVALTAAPGDPIALRRAVSRVLGDEALRARLVAAGAQRVAARDWSRVAGETEAVYADAIRETEFSDAWRR